MGAEPQPTSPGMDEREATILLQVDNVTVNEVRGPNRTELDKGDMTVLKIMATEEELQQLGAGLMTDLAQATHEVLFVIVGEHKVPIIKNIPIIKKEERRYTFVIPGLFLEMVMPEDIDPEETEVLEALFKSNGVLRIKGEPPAEVGIVTVVNDRGERAVEVTIGDKISSGITKVGDKIIGGINTATPAVQEKITSGSAFACGKLERNAQPVEISDSTNDKLRKTRLATKTAVIVSEQMATAMVNLARNLGAQLGAVVGETPLAQRGQENEKLQEVKKVAVTGAVTAATVLDTGTEALKAVLKTSCDGLSKVVSHKYGEDAGKACGEGLNIAQDVVAAGTNIKKVGVKGLAKTAGKEAAKNIASQGPSSSSSGAQP